MKIERTFKAPINEASARERIDSYFAQAGYQKISEKGIGLTFRRGTKTGSWLAINPSQVLAVADIQVKSKVDHVEVRGDFEIKTVIRDDTHFTEQFWSEEMKDLERALVKGEYSSLKGKNLTARALLAVGKSLVGPLLYVLIWGALSLGFTFLVMRLPEFSNTTYPEIIALFSMALAAVITYILYRYFKRRRKARW
jgi:hypothetical protein